MSGGRPCCSSTVAQCPAPPAVGLPISPWGEQRCSGAHQWPVGWASCGVGLQCPKQCPPLSAKSTTEGMGGVGVLWNRRKPRLMTQVGRDGRWSSPQRSHVGTQGTYLEGLCPTPQPHPYRTPGSPQVQVNPLASLIEVSFHILLPEAQERVHADVQAALGLLPDTKSKNLRPHFSGTLSPTD